MSDTKNAEKTMSTDAKNYVQNVLIAAGAEAFAPVTEGFALSEKELGNIGARLGEQAATIAGNEAALQTEKDALVIANAEIVTLKDSNIKLQATVNEYKGKKAPVAPDPAAGGDKIEDPKTQFRTSVDAEAEKMYGK